MRPSEPALTRGQWHVMSGCGCVDLTRPSRVHGTFCLEPVKPRDEPRCNFYGAAISPLADHPGSSHPILGYLLCVPVQASTAWVGGSYMYM